MSDKRVRTFLIDHGFDLDGLSADQLLDDFEFEMKAGLAGSESSLRMIPTFIRMDRDLPEERPVVVMDAGGTNLRVASVRFRREGGAEMTGFSQHRMPGIERELSAEEFFEQCAQYLLPVLSASRNIGFCFSYPSEITPDGDGKLLYWTKEIKAPGVVGQFVGAHIVQRLAAHGHSDCRMVVLNDTIATLLAGRTYQPTRRYGGYVGFILGTGTNTAYVEHNQAISKRHDLDPEGIQPINVESGGFDKAPASDFDRRFDAATDNPGGNVFEKMISGAYMGPLAHLILCDAGQGGLLSSQAATELESRSELETRDVGEFLADPFGGGTVSSLCENDDDRAAVQKVFSSLVERAALLTAANISAAVLKSGTGRDPLHPVCVNIDGSTYYKVHGLRPRVEALIDSILRPRGVHVELIHVDDAPTIGAAVAGLTQWDA